MQRLSRYFTPFALIQPLEGPFLGMVLSHTAFI